MTRYVAVVGPAEATADEVATAEAVGAGLARQGATVVTGGRGGVMAAACRGAVESGGTTVGILPGASREEANQWVTVAIPRVGGRSHSFVSWGDPNAFWRRHYGTEPTVGALGAPEAGG